MAALFERDGGLVREDICQDAWQSAPEGAFAWWQTRVPVNGAPLRQHIDEGLVYDCFLRLEGETDPQKVNFRYVLALWLLRHRKFKFEEVHKDDRGEWLVLREPRIRKLHQVFDPHLNEEAIGQVQQDVEKMLQAA